MHIKYVRVCAHIAFKGECELGYQLCESMHIVLQHLEK